MDPKLAADLKARKAERAAAAVVRPRLVAPDDDPDVPWDPLPAGALQAAIAASDPAYAAELRRAERAARPPDADSIRVRAVRLLADNLDELESIARASNATPQERTAALAQIARIADAYSSDGATALADRPLCTLTFAELSQRVAEIDARRGQLLAAIEAGRQAAG